MTTAFVLEDGDHPASRPLARFRSIFSQRNGIFTPLERLRLREPGCELFLKHPDQNYESLVAAMHGLKPASQAPADAKTRDSNELLPWILLENAGISIQSDLALMKNTGNLDVFQSGPDALHDAKFSLEGPAEALFIHPDARLLPGTVLDTTEGPVVLDAGCRIAPFSYLAGPVYIGRGAQIDNAHISGGCIIGEQVRAGGEIGGALINDFSNKHHEGFLGHSVLGSWVNLGALTTTSDLKNNYGQIRLLAPVSTPDSQREEIQTGLIKFGSVIGDCVKVAIGTMINTGTILDAGANAFGGQPPKYLPPLAWGVEDVQYDPARFLADCEKIMARRNIKPAAELPELVERLL